MAITVGTGTTITFQTGFFAEILSMKWSGISRGSIETSHMGTTPALTFAPANLFDPGTLEVEIHHIPATRPPIDQAAATCTITFPGGKTWAASAFMTDYEITDVLEDKIKATGKVKFSGQITIV